MTTMMTTMEATTYAELVREFPPRPIHTKKQHDATMEVVRKLAVRGEDDLSRDETDYLDALTTFLEQYDRAYALKDRGRKKKTPLEWLKNAMKVTGMIPADLGRLLGNQSLASQILLGKRQLSKDHIRKLADHFGVSTDVFL